ncbi:helix-turn-helix transcriptional regulator [Salmonella enterica]|uniref:Helix-turn-helix transcriptional regulator n=2 Tax=Salmonella enterica TaxID=28901 RepID=A0A5W2LV16_SALET|nr:XRE family transcriptional regulator [Salmonella enterica subsp. enterica serovar Ealing]EAB7819398.1 XRE family transcriptional regulator [Salmonella enterica subsp. enterica]EAB8008894.1 XRE family transcriptional regulator [Salmonella enterica subsp. enterica serovar Muenchen]EAM1506869.1 XRE family transcriptional regulator [Salmonella enterica]EBG8047087.1 helix-turn-helix transcriptional regulator [Salmonella enterica subsp. enterica serovar Oranienburg]EBS5059123.1 XRE family transcr
MSRTIGEKIRIMRKSEMLTQKQMAELTGIPAGTLIHYEQGKSKPGADALIKILKPQKLRKYRDWFLFDEMEPKAGQVIPALARVGQDETESPRYGSNSGE